MINDEEVKKEIVRAALAEVGTQIDLAYNSRMVRDHVLGFWGPLQVTNMSRTWRELTMNDITVSIVTDLGDEEACDLVWKGE